jgi:hypothetical protein
MKKQLFLLAFFAAWVLSGSYVSLPAFAGPTVEVTGLENFGTLMKGRVTGVSYQNYRISTWVFMENRWLSRPMDELDPLPKIDGSGLWQIRPLTSQNVPVQIYLVHKDAVRSGLPPTEYVAKCEYTMPSYPSPPPFSFSGFSWTKKMMKSFENLEYSCCPDYDYFVSLVDGNRLQILASQWGIDGGVVSGVFPVSYGTLSWSTHGPLNFGGTPAPTVSLCLQGKDGCLSKISANFGGLCGLDQPDAITLLALLYDNKGSCYDSQSDYAEYNQTGLDDDITGYIHWGPDSLVCRLYYGNHPIEPRETDLAAFLELPVKCSADSGFLDLGLYDGEDLDYQVLFNWVRWIPDPICQTGVGGWELYR